MSYCDSLPKLSPCSAGLMLSIISRHISLSPDSAVLDAGCGRGERIAALMRTGAAITGIDRDTSSVSAECRNAPNVTLIQCDLADVCRPAGPAEPCKQDIMSTKCDLILCECTLSLLDDPSAMMRTFRSLLKTGGMLVLSDLYTGTADSGRTIISEDGPVRSVFSKNALEMLMLRSGFEIVEFTDCREQLMSLLAQAVFSDAPCLDSGTLGKLRPLRPSYGVYVARISPTGR